MRSWWRVALGTICLLIGLWLVLDPFASMTVLLLSVVVGLALLGLGDLLGQDAGPRGLSTVAGLLWLAAAVAVLAWPGATVSVIAWLTGIVVVLQGAIAVVAGLRGRTPQRVSSVVLGVALLLIGTVALLWPDITIFVVALLLGGWLVVRGVSLLWRGLVRPSPAGAAPAGVGRAGVGPAGAGSTRAARNDQPRPPGRLRRLGTTAVAVLALVVAVLLTGVSAYLHSSKPTPDGFYAAPGSTAGQAPGTLLRTEPFTRDVPSDARAWRILYTTTRDEGITAVASAIVVIGRRAPAGPRPVIAWAHGTTGYAEDCAPSLVAHPFAAGATPALHEVVDNGWVMVATDYIGLGTQGPQPYLIGQGEARSVLDAVRAAHRMRELALADETVVWGHSQGGHAALWTGIIAPRYAPDVDIVGIAALAPASNLPALVSTVDTVTGGSIFASFVVQAYADTYPDVRFDDVVRPAARVQVREMAQRCLSGPEVYVSVVDALLLDKSIFRTDPTTGVIGRRLSANVPSGPIDAPLLIAQGASDTLVLPAAQDEYVQRRCAAGGRVDYRVYAGRDHVGLVAADSPLVPDLLRWTQDRLDGRPARSTCG
ncbi:conserved membrane hypothetical protein [Nostocoides japonicum T1-X7]|uniref:Secretory lipase n=1 Tax=Nostocoides japonicum T1-X7 TaxID=1194083 RepID=A0A077M132_9MICO|nr:lipase family protein [Tetrasphaera japonica]CCH80053.1 conserved membrane hypothetical protein [Tetrasphaera japonica T1-X7]